jgi:hypothetical protein
MIAGILSIFTYSNAQVVIDTVSIGAGYANDVWYSLENDNQGTAPAANWDLAFDVSDYGTSIRINSAHGVTLWQYPSGDTTAWATLDTTGITTWTPRYNSDTEWSMGAFDLYAAGFDVGWAVYNNVTHVVSGDSLYVIQLSDGSYKKLWMQNVLGGAYNFKYANIDGTAETQSSLLKANFSGEMLGYYSLVNDSEVNREPLASSWDLFFGKKTAFIPVPYAVTTVWQNSDVPVAKVTNVVDVSIYSDWSSHVFANEINTIGWDWKSYSGGGYVVEDSLIYFVKSKQGNIWKLVFTGFGGSADGNYIFSKEKISMAGIEDFSRKVVTSMSVYPNPSNGSDITIIYDLPQSFATGDLSVYNLAGEKVYSKNINATQGLHTQKLSQTALAQGMYIVSIEMGGSHIQQKLIVQ